jgi:hypothetical protein
MKPITKSFTFLAIILSAQTLSVRADVVDLTTSPTASGTINGALFFANDQQPAGTGFIQPFLRVQDSGAGTFEQGYNTDGGFPFDDKNPHNFQHSLLLSSLAQFDINGIEYFKFMLDSNQSNRTAHTFSLSQLQFYTSNDPAQTTTTINPDGTLPLGNLAYNLNPGGGTTNSLITTATGSGKFDAIGYVPVSDFNLADKYLILYFAGNGNGGFEEWKAATLATPVPEASTTALLIAGATISIVGAAYRRTRALAGLSLLV